MMVSGGAGRRAALLVGVDHYEDPVILDLACPVNDCIELHAFLKHAAGYDAFQLLRVRLYLSERSEGVGGSWLIGSLQVLVELTPGTKRVA